MKKSKKLKILGFSFGDIRGNRSWSGTNHYFYRALGKRCEIVKIINNMRYGFKRLKNKPFVSKYCHLGFPLALIKKESKSPKELLKKEILNVKEPYNLVFHLNIIPFAISNTPAVLFLDAVLQRSCMYKLASIIFTFSDCLKKFLVEKYKLDSARIITVGAGPNLRSLPKVRSKEYDGKTILFVGNQVIRKGGLTLLRVFKRVKKEVPDARLVMISGEFNDSSKGERGRNLKKFGIFIKGFIDKRELGLWYRKASVFVMPSIKEPFGIALLEAMAYKLPCIGTKKYAIPEIIEDGKTGFLVQPKNPSELAERLIFLLKYPKLARKMGERGRKRIVRYYNWDKVVDRMLPALRRIISKKA